MEKPWAMWYFDILKIVDYLLIDEELQRVLCLQWLASYHTKKHV